MEELRIADQHGRGSFSRAEQNLFPCSKGHWPRTVHELLIISAEFCTIAM
jgi:hypothetical protein